MQRFSFKFIGVFWFPVFAFFFIVQTFGWCFLAGSNMKSGNKRHISWILQENGTVCRRIEKTIRLEEDSPRNGYRITCQNNWSNSTFRVVESAYGTSLLALTQLSSSAAKIYPDQCSRGGYSLSLTFPFLKKGSYVSWIVDETYNEGMLPGHIGFAPAHIFSDSVFLDEDQFTVKIPSTLKLSWISRRMGNKSVPQVFRTGRIKVWRWVSTNLKPVEKQPLMPPVHQFAPFVRTSVARDWKVISQWMGGVLSRNMDVTFLVRDIVKKLSIERNFHKLTELEKVQEVQNKVNSLVQYKDIPMSVVSDINGHSVDLILQNGFGDCVDRAIVFCSILNALDISALPVFVGSRNYRSVEPELPSPYCGDHCLVKVKLKSGSFFIDPASFYLSPGQLPAIYQGVMAFSPLTEEFYKTPDTFAHDNGIDVEHSILLNDNGSYTGNFKLTVFGENKALIARFFQDDSMMKKIVKKMIFLPDFVEIVNCSKPSSMNGSLNSCVISGTYVAFAGKNIGKRLSIRLPGYQNGGKEVSEPERTVPIAYRCPVSHRLLIHVQGKGNNVTFVQPDDYSGKVGSVQYSYKTTIDSNKLIIESSYKREGRHIYPEFYKGFRELVFKRVGCESSPLIVSVEDSKISQSSVSSSTSNVSPWSFLDLSSSGTEDETHRFIEDVSATLGKNGTLTGNVLRTIEGSYAQKLSRFLKNRGSKSLEQALVRKLRERYKAATLSDFQFRYAEKGRKIDIEFSMAIPSYAIKIDDKLSMVKMPFIPLSGALKLAFSRRSLLRLPDNSKLKLIDKNGFRNTNDFSKVLTIDSKTVLWEQEIPVFTPYSLKEGAKELHSSVPVIEYFLR